MTARPDETSPTLLLIFEATFVCLGLVFLVAGPQLFDPHVRFDDYPALFGRPEDYYTYNEGRWINYFWHYRPFIWPAPVNYAVFYLGWALFSGALAVLALTPSARKIEIYLLAALLVICPHTVSISFWASTLLPGVWVIGLYVVALNFISRPKARYLMLSAVPISLMTYSTFPMLVLVAYFVKLGHRVTLRQLILDTMLFVFFFVLGLNLIYALNYLDRGIYGIELADFRGALSWREPEFLNLNLRQVIPFIRNGLQPVAGSTLSIAASVLFAGSALLLAIKSPIQLIALLAAMILGISLLATHLVMNGYPAPFRSLHFVWVTFAVVFSVALARYTNSGLAAPMARMTSVVLMMFVGLFLYRVNSIPVEWQEETRNIAAQIPQTDGIIYVLGNFNAVTGSAGVKVFHKEGLRDRLEYLTKRKVVVCGHLETICLDAVGMQHRPRL